MEEVKRIVKEFYTGHKRIIFNGNGYSAQWLDEAEKRGLPNLSHTVQALSHLDDPEYVALFEKHGVFSAAELRSRKDIYLENYSGQLRIEANLMVEMASRMALPAANRYLQEVLESMDAQRRFGMEPVSQKLLAENLFAHLEAALNTSNTLEHAIASAIGKDEDALVQANSYHKEVVPLMEELRIHVDALEHLTDKAYWPYPSYGDMLFSL
jgi:glutamine synthetase